MASVDTGPAHCVAGQDHIRGYPFMTEVGDALLYHHENWDGSGFFRLAGDAIPLLSRIIRLADMAELSHRLPGAGFAAKREVDDWLSAKSGKLFDPSLVEDFRSLCALPAFWLDLSDEFVASALAESTPRFERDMPLSEIRAVTSIFSRIIDSKSRFTRDHSRELSARAGAMADSYGYSAEDSDKLRIAADLHDIGKLAIGNSILEKPGRLDRVELDVIQRHSYYTRVSLSPIAVFGDIVEWAANHHERLDGHGYPYRKTASELDFNSRLLASLDVYQALTEHRPYREAMSHESALSLMRGQADAGGLDADIVKNIDEVFSLNNIH